MCQQKEVNTVEEKGTSGNNMKDLFISLIVDQEHPQLMDEDLYCHYWSSSEKSVLQNRHRSWSQHSPLNIAKGLKADIVPSDAGLISFSKHQRSQQGKTKLTLLDNRGVTGDKVAFELVDSDFPPILGLTSSVHLGVVKRTDNVSTADIIFQYADCFEGVGCLDRKQQTQVDPTVQPTVNRSQCRPQAMTDRVKAELDKMEEMNIISKVDQAPEWVNSMVVAEKKDGGVRICLDPRELNKAIIKEHHHILTLEDISHKFAGMKIFTIMDMKHAYWHVKLYAKSLLLTTLGTRFGRCCFEWLPFGINSAAEVFEKRVEDLFGDLNMAIYFDDLIVFGKDQKEHDRNLHQLLELARAKM